MIIHDKAEVVEEDMEVQEEIQGIQAKDMVLAVLAILRLTVVAITAAEVVDTEKLQCRLIDNQLEQADV